MAKSDGTADKRLALLEKAYREDRERWRKSDERWRKNDERIMKMLRVLENHNKRFDKTEESLDASLKILYRLMEKLEE